MLFLAMIYCVKKDKSFDLGADFQEIQSLWAAQDTEQKSSANQSCIKCYILMPMSGL